MSVLAIHTIHLLGVFFTFVPRWLVLDKGFRQSKTAEEAHTHTRWSRMCVSLIVPPLHLPKMKIPPQSGLAALGWCPKSVGNRAPRRHAREAAQCSPDRVNLAISKSQHTEEQASPWSKSLQDRTVNCLRSTFRENRKPSISVVAEKTKNPIVINGYRHGHVAYVVRRNSFRG